MPSLKEKQEERVLKEAEELEVKRVRDSATTAKRKTMERFERSFDSLDSINRNIKPIYHVKLKYIDRDVDDAIRILSSTKYEQ